MPDLPSVDNRDLVRLIRRVFHDLRHVGGTLAATTGASRRELMARLGHSSTRAALIYQHATRDRDKAIALALGDLVREVRTAQSDEVPEGRSLTHDRLTVWHVFGANRSYGPAGPGGRLSVQATDLGFLVGAGEGNRTLMTSLEGWGSAIELRPR